MLAADGVANTRIAARVGVNASTVRAWRDRFAEEGLAKLGKVRAGRGRKSNIPQSDPCTGTILFGDEVYRLPVVPDGTYYALAVAIDAPLDPINFFIPDTMLRGRSGAITVCDGVVEGTGDLELRPARLIDPPILIALPYLFVRYLSMNARGMSAPMGG